MKDRRMRTRRGIRGGRGGRTRYCFPTRVQGSVQLLGDHGGTQEDGIEKTGETLLRTPDLPNWVKRLETQKGSDNKVPQHLCSHTLSSSLACISINTVCYQQCCFTVPCA